MRSIIITLLFLTLAGCSQRSNTFTIPEEYEFYKCETWKWEGDCPNTISIPTGEFWGLIRMYNIAGWDNMSYLFEHRDELIKWQKNTINKKFRKVRNYDRL